VTALAALDASVILAVRNAVSTVGAQLAAIAAQEFEGSWEVVFVDNGSTDGTAAVASSWDRPGVPLYPVSADAGPGAAYAKNVGAAVARGRILVFCDGDDVVQPGWLAAHVRAQGAAAGLVGGAFVGRPPVLPGYLDWMPFADSANLSVAADVFLVAGGFDEGLRYSSDRELSWRLQLAGTALRFAPDALVAKGERARLRSVVRQNLRWGWADVVIYRRYRSVGQPRADTGHALRQWRGLLRRPAGDDESRRAWAREAGRRIGRLLASIRYRTLFL
jgi:glycosyltransferase involved in cell wall biosynthesis